MKDHIKNIVNAKDGYDLNRNRIREYLQEYFLYILYKNKFYNEMVFCGGTALRFIHNIKRFSEDLDFSLSAKAKKFIFADLAKTVEKEFLSAGYDVEVKLKRDIGLAVAGAFFKFPGLLHEFNVTPHKDEVLAIKLEIDLNPPSGGVEEVTSVTRDFIFYSRHYDIFSLFAGKSHAILRRRYAKGRDWYDLFWYLTKIKNLEPNYLMLNNALKQNSSDGLVIDKNNFYSELKKVVARIDFDVIRRDAVLFLEFPPEADVLTRENFLNILK